MTSGETLISVESNGIDIMPLATLLSSYWRADGSTKRHDAWCTQYCVASVPKIMSPRKTKADHRQPMPDLDDLDIISERTMRLNQVVTGEKLNLIIFMTWEIAGTIKFWLKKFCRLIQRSAIPSASKASGPAPQRIVAVSGAMANFLR
jgi:hypothetical protein